MNAERLHAVAIALKNELKELSTLSQLSNLVEALEGVTQDSNQRTQSNLNTHLQTILLSLPKSRVDKFSPTWREILREMGGEQFFGNNLKTHIEAVIDKNQMMPAVAHEELQKTLTALENFDSALGQILGAFEEFHIGTEELKPGECEIGILIPRAAVKSRLSDFADELEDLTFILNTFAEVATGKADELRIKTISSSGLLVFLEAAKPLAACVATAIDKIVGVYKKVLEIREIRDKGKQKLPAKITSEMEDYANSLVEGEIPAIAKGIVAEFMKSKSQDHELTVRLERSLTKIANKIDAGFNLEVRIQPTLGQDGQADKQTKKYEEIIELARANMEFLKLEGDPILKLPENTSEEPESEPKQKKSRKIKLPSEETQQ